MTEQLELPDDRPIPRSDAVVGLSVLGLLAAVFCGSLLYRIAGPTTGPQTLPTPTVVVTPNASEASLVNKDQQPAKVDIATLFQQDAEVAPATYEEPLSTER